MNPLREPLGNRNSSGIYGIYGNRWELEKETLVFAGVSCGNHGGNRREPGNRVLGTVGSPLGDPRSHPTRQPLKTTCGVSGVFASRLHGATLAGTVTEQQAERS